MKNKVWNKKYLFIPAFLCLFLIGGVFAYWTQELQVRNEFKTAKYDTKIVEDFIAPYTATFVEQFQSKGGLITMTKSFALEGSARDVRFNTVTPGFIATEMTDKLSDEIKESYTSKIPLKRFGSPKDIAEAVAFLLSDSSAYITGEVLKVNGGMYM